MIQKQLPFKQSRVITQFSINTKQTPQTRHTPHSSATHTPNMNKCEHCQDYIIKVTQLKQKQVWLELKIHELQQRNESLERQSKELINKSLMTYEEYHRKMLQQNRLLWDRNDLEAQLFQAKTILELLFLSKGIPSHPKIQPLQIQTLKQKYSNLLVQQLRMQEQLVIRDKIIQDKVFNPIYNYDSRITTLRKAIAFWYKKSEEECSRMKQRCKDMKHLLNKQIQNMRDAMNNDIQVNRQTLSKILEAQRSQKTSKKERKVKPIKIQEQSVKNQVKKMR